MALGKQNTPSLYVIADRGSFTSDDTWLQAIGRVGTALCDFTHGALQIRVKGLEKDRLEECFEMARKTVAPFLERGLPILLNARLEQALHYEFSGVHLSEIHRPTTPISRESHPNDFLIAAATHDLAGIKNAHQIGADFVVLSPVFEVPAKALSGMGIAAFQTIIEQSSLPVLALGGASPKRVESCMRAGAAGVATLSSLMKTPSPEDVLHAYEMELQAHVTEEKL